MSLFILYSSLHSSVLSGAKSYSLSFVKNCSMNFYWDTFLKSKLLERGSLISFLSYLSSMRAICKISLYLGVLYEK